MKNTTKISKFLSLILRHNPGKIGLTLDKCGWANVGDLLRKANRLNMETLEHIVDTCDKKRYEFNDDKTKIRARQGHSVKVDLGYKPQEPPAILYHGTTDRFADAINKEGLKKMNRHAVHLSADLATAESVGRRHGKLMIYMVSAHDMYEDGHKFYVSNNGVWLTDNVPVKYLSPIPIWDYK